VLGEDPANTQTRTIIEQRIVEEDDDDGGDDDCDLSYPDVCIPPFPPDLDCPEVPHTNFKVLPPDLHDFDREGDGIGCESGTIGVSSSGLDGNGTLLPPPDPCLDNPNLPECPNPCIENPDAAGCPGPCEVNPNAEGCQVPPPVNPCEENPFLPECQEEDTGQGFGSVDEGDEGSADDESSDDENGDGEGNEGSDPEDDGGEEVVEGSGSDEDTEADE
jgi:hypothetical protein